MLPLLTLLKWNMHRLNNLPIKVLFLIIFLCYDYYHCRFVSKQIKLKSSARIIFESENKCKVVSLAGTLQTTITSCHLLDFHTVTLLSHFYSEKRREIPLFCEQLIAPRLSLKHIKTVYGNKVTSFHSESYEVNE